MRGLFAIAELLVSLLFFEFMVPCGRLSWLLVCFWAHVKIVVSYRIVSVYTTLEGWFGLSPPPLSRPLRVRSSSRSSTVPSRAWSKTCSSQRSMSDGTLVNMLSSPACARPPRLEPPSSAANLPWCRRVSVRNLAPAGISGTCRDTTDICIYVAFHSSLQACSQPTFIGGFQCVERSQHPGCLRPGAWP